MYSWIKLSDEAKTAAKWQAARGYDGSVGTPLPNLLSDRACKEIEKNPVWFRLAVNIFRGFGTK
jgi:hypothetical protein